MRPLVWQAAPADRASAGGSASTLSTRGSGADDPGIGTVTLPSEACTQEVGGLILRIGIERNVKGPDSEAVINPHRHLIDRQEPGVDAGHQQITGLRAGQRTGPVDPGQLGGVPGQQQLIGGQSSEQGKTAVALLCVVAQMRAICFC